MASRASTQRRQTVGYTGYWPTSGTWRQQRSHLMPVALITDGRFSGGSHGFVVGHVSPEAALGGPMALVKNGDEITIDAERREISLHVSAAELRRRRKSWKPPKPYARRGALVKYAKHVSSASLGAVTDLE